MQFVLVVGIYKRSSVDVGARLNLDLANLSRGGSIQNFSIELVDRKRLESLCPAIRIQPVPCCITLSPTVKNSLH
jgi:hypothetical protein